MQNMLSKQELTSQELQMLSSEMEKRQKQVVVTWLLWFFLGSLGGHRYYLGRTGTAIAQTLTLGGLGIWALIDLFLISGMIRQENEKIEMNIIQDIQLMKKAKMNEAAATLD
ncbi:TM2 domain-containing protein [Schinkia azotoformans]|uniref:TM2 domain-containing protein n=1 Tax=Schinkia azotoformans TaxID=1454 RepID=UPI002DBD77DF|nr:TM2 domain-containing protein [Schinkia azotoformans]MEC1719129.1 TM2 domain-containing protein [Schinkia azotoformans]MED4413823.1 TM2 domain-containing protein [Schinkia azotoformans]